MRTSMDPMDPRSYMPLPLCPLPQTQALSSSTFHLPPLDGSMTIPRMWDWHYDYSPNHPVFQYSDDKGVTTLYMRNVVPAIHLAGRWIMSRYPASTTNTTNRPLIGILAASDSITSFTMILGIVRAGYAVFPISTRNSPGAVIHLLAKTRVDHLIVGPEEGYKRLAREALMTLEKSGENIPSTSTMPVFEDLYRHDTRFEPLPPQEADLKDVVIYLHSSGSTAYPKPVPWAYYHQLTIGIGPFFGERDWSNTKLSIHSLPMYHGMGIIMTFWGATVGITFTVFKPQSPAVTANAENTFKGVIDTKSDLVFCVPSFVETWAADPERVQLLKGMQGIIYGGGPLLKEVGDRLFEEGISIFTLYGCTEVGIMNTFLPQTGYKDWQYFTFQPNVSPHFFQYDDDKVEVAFKACNYGMIAVMNTMIDSVGAYNVRDLLASHPTKPGYWKVIGRTDDQIMHSTGEKTNPGPLEKILRQDPHVQSSIMFGRGRFNAGILIEPRPEYSFDPADPAKLEAFRNAVWPTIEEMNEYAPQHSRVFKEMIIVTSPSKPFQYTAKNEPRRQAMLDLYEREINALYDAVDETTQADLDAPASWTQASTIEFVRTVVARVLNHPVGDTSNLFRNGCDSLQATWIRNTILHALRTTVRVNTRDIPVNFVYKHPTIVELGSFVSALAAERPADVS